MELMWSGKKGDTAAIVGSASLSSRQGQYYLYMRTMLRVTDGQNEGTKGSRVVASYKDALIT